MHATIKLTLFILPLWGGSGEGHGDGSTEEEGG
jgi:hypothetical protein